MPECLSRKQTVATLARFYWLYDVVYARTSLLFARIFGGDDITYNRNFPGYNHIRGCRNDFSHLLPSVLDRLLFCIKM